jgi:probable rRNA maturation factor
MSIRIVDKQKRVEVPRSSVRRLVRRILSDHGRAGSDVTVIFAADGFLHELNLTYRRVDRPTDVLAFAMDEAFPVGRGVPEDLEPVLGDVVISTDRAAVQARRMKRTVDHEILKLVSHGVLHLLGYDHERAGDRREMRRLENRYAREALRKTATQPRRGRTKKR